MTFLFCYLLLIVLVIGIIVFIDGIKSKKIKDILFSSLLVISPIVLFVTFVLH